MLFTRLFRVEGIDMMSGKRYYGNDSQAQLIDCPRSGEQVDNASIIYLNFREPIGAQKAYTGSILVAE